MRNIDAKISEIGSEIAEIERLFSQLGGSYQLKPMNQADILLSDVLNVRIGKANLKTTKANLEVAKQNLEVSQRLIQAIEQFDRSSTKLTRWMLCLTIIIAILTAVMTFSVIVQIIMRPV